MSDFATRNAIAIQYVTDNPEVQSEISDLLIKLDATAIAGPVGEATADILLKIRDEFNASSDLFNGNYLDAITGFSKIILDSFVTIATGGVLDFPLDLAKIVTAAATAYIYGYFFGVDTTSPQEPQSTLPVAGAGTAAISHAFLWSFDDISGPAGVTYTIVTEPTHGAILLNGSKTTTFTQADIDSGLVQFRENGDVASGDSFTFKVSDEAGNAIGPEPFRIAILDQTGPIVTSNETLSLPNGSNVAPLNPFLLDTVALDNAPDQMTYTLLMPPAHGLIINDGAPATSFTQADIDYCSVLYVENGDIASGDSFIFQVSDAAGNHTVPQRFTIDVQGVSSNLVLSGDGSGNNNALASGTEGQPTDPKFTFDDVSAPVADASNWAAPSILDLVDATGSGQGSDTSTSDATTYWVLMNSSSSGDCQG